jgi:hypothetical protein
MKKDLRDWMFRALLFEAEADKFRAAGIRLGADIRESEFRLLEEVLNPFPVILRNEALRMIRIYGLLYCFENSVREIIRDRLEEKYGIDWCEKGVPRKIRDLAESRKQSAKNNSWLEGDKADLMSFTEFGHLADIIIENWEDFSDLVPSQHWLKQRFDELEQTRNFIAHNRLLLPSEFSRIEMYISDWNKQVGL